MHKAHIITSTQELSSLYAELKDSDWITIDTEFIREKTYYPRLCLIQLATPERVACIDTLAFAEFEPLQDLLQNQSIVKVFHAAQQDLEIIYLHFGMVPTPIFDTQIAASLTGYGDQISYANLVKQLLEVTLDKSQVRTNWALRPLSSAQIRYALDDVRYLRNVYTILKTELKNLNRLDWLRDDFAQLEDPNHYIASPSKAWLKVRGQQKLSRRQLAVLESLAKWREQEAMKQNRPRKWVLSDAALFDLSQSCPKTLKDMSRLRRVPGNVVGMTGKVLLNIIKEASARPESEWPQKPIHRNLDIGHIAIIDLMQALLKYKSSINKISTSAIASRDTLEQLLLGNTNLPLLRGWRGELVGKALLELLSGKLDLGVEQNQIRIKAP